MDERYFQILREDMKAGFEGGHERLDSLNGRTRQNEQDIAVLKDRDQLTTDKTARWGAVGAILTGAGAALAAWWRG